jgi:kynurenine formamidase
MLLKDDQSHNIAGFVSIDYRLSPYPSHPTLPSSPSDDSRNSQHPEHLNDIRSALSFLGARSGTEVHLKKGGTVQLPDTRPIIGGRFVLCGHSCGATLAMQATALLSVGGHGISPPVALLGMEGIYDLNALVATHSHPAYREFITGAFGEDEKTWVTASQLCCKLQKWQGNVLLIHSVNDELVDMQQTDSIMAKLVMQGFTDTTATTSSARNEGKQVSKVIIDCLHDEVWENGAELVRAIRAVTDKKFVSESPNGFSD